MTTTRHPPVRKRNRSTFRAIAFVGAAATLCSCSKSPPTSTSPNEAAASALPEHCFAPENPAAGPAMGEPEEDPAPREPEAMPDVAAPTEPAAASAHERCAAGDAAGCAGLARYWLEASRDEALGRTLVRRSADLEWAAFPASPERPATVEAPAAVVAAFRKAFVEEVLPALEGRPIADVARGFGECMASDAQFLVRRMARRPAYRELAFSRLYFPESLLAGRVEDLGGGGWVWSVMFLGASRRFPPSGAFAGFIDPADGRLILAYHIPEG